MEMSAADAAINLALALLLAAPFFSAGWVAGRDHERKRPQFRAGRRAVMADYDRSGTARRILAAAGRYNADGELVGVAVGTSSRVVEVDPDTMIRLLDRYEALLAENAALRERQEAHVPRRTRHLRP